MQRRRLVAAGALAASLAGIVVLNMGLSGAVPAPPRQHILLQKQCPKAQFSPTFLVSNVTDNQSLSNDKQTWAPEVLTVYITLGDKVPAEIGGPAANGYLFKVVVNPGQTKVVTTPANMPWGGPHFAHFSAEYRGVVKIMSSRQTCNCEDDIPIEETTSTLDATTSSSSSSTSTSTSSTSSTTSSTTSTTTTTVPESTTSTTAADEPTTSTTAPEEETTTTTAPDEDTTTTTAVIDDT